MLGINAPPVTIKNIECAIIDRGWEEGWVVPEPPEARTGKKVAVVGSGPAGLCAAAQLNKRGALGDGFRARGPRGRTADVRHPEHEARQAEVVQRRVDLMAKEGVKFVTNTEVGRNYPAEKLLQGI